MVSGRDGCFSSFSLQIVQIEDMAKQFIDVSFKKLRSAEGAFDLLQNIKNIKSRDAINNQMMSKFNDILVQYSKEVDIIDEMFRNNRYDWCGFNDGNILFITDRRHIPTRSNPPVAKNQPKVAGAINWCRSLFTRLKKSIVRFQVVPEMLTSELGKSVTKKYITTAKSMREYEELVGKKLGTAWYLVHHSFPIAPLPASSIASGARASRQMPLSA